MKCNIVECDVNVNVVECDVVVNVHFGEKLENTMQSFSVVGKGVTVNNA